MLINWNANGLRTRTNELRHFLNAEKVDIMVLTETRLNVNDRLNVTNYKTYRHDSNYRGGGVAILIRKNIPHMPLPYIDINIANIGIKLQDGTIIRAIYNRPRHNITNDELTQLTKDYRVLLVGDFNARHTSWNNKKCNKNGKVLYDYAENNNLAISAPDRPTHYPANGTTPTIIDLILNKNYPHPLIPVSLSQLSSDHNPVTVTLTNTKINETSVQIYDYKNTNWKLFRKIVNDRLTINNNIDSQQELDEEVDVLTKIIQDARDATTKLIKQKPKVETLPQNIKDLITFKNKIKKRWQRCRRLTDKRRLIELQDTIKTRLDEYKNDVWGRKIETLATSNNTLWKMSKLLKKPFNDIATLTINNQTLTMDQDKADAIAKNIQKICTSSPDETDEQRRITEDLTNMTTTLTRCNVPSRTLTKMLASPNKILEIIKYLPNNKAPGPDSIPNLVLKNLPLKAVVALTNIINKITILQQFPKKWKKATIIPILKPAKNPHNPNSYRPIALLDTMSKIAEKVILKNLRYHINKNNLINKEQLGFRKGSSTIHAAARIVQDAIMSFNRKQTTVALLLDIEKAFDTVWLNGLTYKLIHLHKLPKHMTNLLYSYMTNRSIQVKINNTLSSMKLLNAGVPQGTVLSPILYNLYVSDLPTCPITKTTMYADDTTIYASSFSAQTATQKIKYHLDKLMTYYKDWKIQINEQKTETITLTRRFTETTTFSKIKINNEIVKENNTVKYLGITLDRRLSFIKQVNKILQKVYTATSKLYPLINRRSRLSTKNKLLIYKTIIRPTITYGGPIYHNISDTQYKRLQTTQNKLLRLVTNANRYTNMTRLHDEHKIKFIKTQIKEAARKFYQQQIQTCELTRGLHYIPDDIRRVHKYLTENLD